MKNNLKSFGLCFGLLVVTLFLFFNQSLNPQSILFNNDGPLGAQIAGKQALSADGAIWNEGFWIGSPQGNLTPSLSSWIFELLTPFQYARLYQPLCLLFLGVCSFLFFRTAKFSVAVSILGSIAVTLNQNFFSNVAWGLGTRATLVGFIFLALAFLYKLVETKRWIHWVGIGLCLAFTFLEGFDVAFLFIAWFGIAVIFFFLEFNFSVDNILKSIKPGLIGIVLVGASLFVCSYSGAEPFIKSIIFKSDDGLSNPNLATKSEGNEKYDWATQWSLPKLETLRVIIPGAFGYRMDSANGKQYFGSVGQSANYPKEGIARFSGSGEYPGLLVLFLAGSVVLLTLKKKAYICDQDAKIIKFFAWSALICLVLSFGRHIPLYYFVHKLPILNSIRNPMKFMHIFHLCIIILFGYGLKSLFNYWSINTEKFKFSIKNLLTKPILITVGVIFFAIMIFASSKNEFINSLVVKGFYKEAATATFSSVMGELKWFFVLTIVSAATIYLVAKKFFTSISNSAIALGVVLLVDFGRTNINWVVYEDWEKKYTSNAVVKLLAANAGTSRVTISPIDMKNPEVRFFNNYYYAMWLEHLFPFYGIRSINTPQEPRVSERKREFLLAFAATNTSRLWALTGTRFILGVRGVAEVFNQQLETPIYITNNLVTTNVTMELEDVAGERKEIETPYYTTNSIVTTNNGRYSEIYNFNLANRKNGTQNYDTYVDPNTTNNLFSLVHFNGALPRIALYTNWYVAKNDSNSLGKLIDREFDLGQNLVVNNADFDKVIRKDKTISATNPPVKISHAPGRTEIEIGGVISDGILTMNDAYDQDVRVTVNGVSKELLRVNHLFRGVYLDSDSEKTIVKFNYEPSKKAYYTSFVGIFICMIILVGFGIFELFYKKHEV